MLCLKGYNGENKVGIVVENFMDNNQRSGNTFQKYSPVLYFFILTHLSLIFSKSKVSKVIWLIGQLTWLPIHILLMSSFSFFNLQMEDTIETSISFSILMMIIMATSFILAQYQTYKLFNLKDISNYEEQPKFLRNDKIFTLIYLLLALFEYLLFTIFFKYS